MSPRKIGHIPARDNPEEQENFKAEKLEPRLAEARAGQRWSSLWMPRISFMHRFLPWSGVSSVCLSKRQRSPTLECPDGFKCHNQKNIYGSEPDLRDCRYGMRVTASAGRDASGIAYHYRADNARYQKCILVQELASSLNIELLYCLLTRPILI